MTLRNETNVDLAGTTYRLRFDIGALMLFEEKAQVGLPYIQTAIAMAFSDTTETNEKKMLNLAQYFKTRWAVAAIYAGLANTEKPLTWDQVLELCQKHGTDKLAVMFLQIYPYLTGGERKKNDQTADQGDNEAQLQG